MVNRCPWYTLITKATQLFNCTKLRVYAPIIQELGYGVLQPLCTTQVPSEHLQVETLEPSTVTLHHSIPTWGSGSPTGDGYYNEFHKSFLYSIRHWPWLPQLQHLSTAKSLSTAIYLHLWWRLLLYCSWWSRQYADSAYWNLLPRILWCAKLITYTDMYL